MTKTWTILKSFSNGSSLTQPSMRGGLSKYWSALMLPREDIRKTMPLGQFQIKRSIRRDRLLAEGFDPESVMVPGSGPVPCRVMFIGERPGKDEPWHQPPMPFVGMAGQELDRYLLLAGLRRDGVYVTNLVKNYRDCEPEEWEIERDAMDLQNEMDACEPYVIVTLGAFATKHFRGPNATMEMVSGIPSEWLDENFIFPIYHPAAGLHNPESIISIVDGFERLGRFLRGQLQAPEDAHPAPRYERLKRGSVHFQGRLVGLDTEGWRHNPLCLTYSTEAGTGTLISVDDRDMLKQFGDKIRLHLDRIPDSWVLLHNSLHDLAVMSGLGVELPEGRFIDTMVLAYLLCKHPQGLKALAYRLAGMEMDAYEDVVGPYSKEMALAYLQVLADNDWGPAEHYCIVETVGGVLVPKVKKPHSLNQRINRMLSDYGKTSETDLRGRWQKLRSDNPALAEPAELVFGEMPEADLTDVPPEVMERYANRDADATLRIAPGLMSEVVDMGLEGVMRVDHDIIPMVDRMQRVGLYINKKHYTDYLTPKMEREMLGIQNEIKTATGAWINPDSGDQCAALLFDQLGLPWTKLTKGKKRPKCDDKVLTALIPYHPVVKMVTDYRERSKIRSSFSLVFPRMVSSDNRLRCNLRLTRVSSGRLAANTPNLLAVPVRSDLGLEVRMGVEAEEGHILADWDLDQIEMREMAHQSQDKTMCGIFQEGKVDIHQQTAAFMFGRRPNDVTKIQRYAAKRVGFGVITGITGLGLVDQMAMAGAEGWTEDRCDEAIGEWFRMYPQVQSYMDSCRQELRRYGFVRDRWGRIRYLPGIHSSLKHVRQEAERQSHSFKISASAQGIMKRGMKRVWDSVIKEWWRMSAYVEPLLQIHDSLLMEIEDGLWEPINAQVMECLTGADTLRVPIKAKGGWGRNWGRMNEIKA